MAKALRFQSGLPIHFWDYCLLAATYIINRIPTVATNYKTPFESLHNQSPSHAHFRTIGCLCFASVHPSDKFAPRALKCVFLGYPADQKGYVMYDLSSKHVFVSRHVVFHESIFPFLHSDPPTTNVPDIDVNMSHDPSLSCLSNPGFESITHPVIDPPNSSNTISSIPSSPALDSIASHPFFIPRVSSRIKTLQSNLKTT